MPPPKLKQKPSQSLRYKTAREVRKTLTSDMIGRCWDRCYSPDGVGRQYRAMQKSSAVLSRIEDIQVPLLVVHGLADTLLPPEHGRDIALRVSGAELVEVEGMGHDLEGPFSTRVADEVIRFAGKA